MNLDYPLLNLILRQIDQTFQFDLPTYFTNDVSVRYNGFFQSKYRYLVIMYPIHFMHFAFYDAYKAYYSLGYDLNSFSQFFIPHQTQSGRKYKNFIHILKNNLDEIMNMSILTLGMNQMSLKTEPDQMDQICGGLTELSLMPPKFTLNHQG